MQGPVPLALALLLAPLVAGAQEDAVSSEVPADASFSGSFEGPLPGSRWGGLVRAFYGYSEDSIGTGGGDTVSGVDLREARLYFEYLHKGIILRTEFELGTGSVELEDAYVRWNPHHMLDVRGGNLKPRTTRSAAVDPDKLVFRDRTFLGETLDFYEIGLAYGGAEDRFNWSLAMTNGTDGDQSDVFASLRIGWASYEGELDFVEGARGAPDYLITEFGVFGFIDTVADSSFFDGGGLGGDFGATLGPWSFHAEYAHLGDNFAGQPIVVLGNGMIQLQGNGDPFSITLGRRFHETMQGSLRWQMADDVNDTEYWGFALNHFPSEGPFVVTGDLSYYEANGPEGWVFSLGVGFGASRPAGEKLPR